MKTAISIALWLMCTAAVAAPGQSGPRAGQIEYTLGLVRSLSDSVEGREGSTLDLASRTGFQAGIDYYLSNQLAIGFDATWVRPRFDALLVPDDGSPAVSISNRASVFSGQFNASYLFSQGPVTPYVEGGLGWTYFDSNVSEGAPVTGCWWDPWWGYICSDFYRSYNSTSFSYGVAAGMRWNIARDIAVKAGYRWLEVEADSLRKKPTLESVLLEVAFRF